MAMAMVAGVERPLSLLEDEPESEFDPEPEPEPEPDPSSKLVLGGPWSGQSLEGGVSAGLPGLQLPEPPLGLVGSEFGEPASVGRATALVCCLTYTGN